MDLHSHSRKPFSHVRASSFTHGWYPCTSLSSRKKQINPSRNRKQASNCDRSMAASGSLVAQNSRTSYIVLAEACNHNNQGVEPACCEDRELLMEPVQERSKLGFGSLWEWYQDALMKRPLCTQMITSGVLWSLGDLVAQSLSLAMAKPAPAGTGGPASVPVEDDLSSLNWRRVAASGSFGGAFVGPTGHYWYQYLDYVCTTKLRLEPNSGRFVGAKLCADTLLFGPLHLLVFFFYMSLVAGKTLHQFRQELQRDYFPTLLSEALLWTCVQVVNFRYVPVKHQLLFVNCVCLVDSAFLSWIKHSDNLPWKNWTSRAK